MGVHPTAVIDERATIGPNVEVGPYAVIEGPVSVGDGSRILAHAVVTGKTTLGSDNVVHMGAVLGHEPQDLSYPGGPAELRVGDRNVFREHSEVHGGSRPGRATVIGNDNYLMTQAHVAHDCCLGDWVVMASGAKLGGHVEVGDRAFLGGNSVVHQFVRVGQLALTRGLSRASRDVPPFCVMDETHIVRALNRVGLRRAGFDAQRIRRLQRAFSRLFRCRTNLRVAVAEIESGPVCEDVRFLLEFIRVSERGVCMGPRRPLPDSAKSDGQ